MSVNLILPTLWGIPVQKSVPLLPVLLLLAFPLVLSLPRPILDYASAAGLHLLARHLVCPCSNAGPFVLSRDLVFVCAQREIRTFLFPTPFLFAIH